MQGESLLPSLLGSLTVVSPLRSSRCSLSFFLSLPLRPDVLPPNKGASLGTGEFDSGVGWGWKLLNRASGHAALCRCTRPGEGRAGTNGIGPVCRQEVWWRAIRLGTEADAPCSGKLLGCGVRWGAVQCGGRPGVDGGEWCSTRDAAVEC
ncbi:hypothetical protein BD779DRAFT_898376 [Infundibulicybe gibba]|nr:hypothetical protein BD779DRAFT_898376 [Infundibulicybe gibba]